MTCLSWGTAMKIIKDVEEVDNDLIFTIGHETVFEEYNGVSIGFCKVDEQVKVSKDLFEKVIGGLMKNKKQEEIK